MKAAYAVLVVSLALMNVALSQSSQVRWSTFSGGYAVPQSTMTKAQSMVAQSFVGSSSNQTSRIASGFLAILDIVTGVGEGSEGEIPLVYSLSQNYPNPFNPSTKIHYEIPANSRVILTVYDVLGREVSSLVDEEKAAGRYDAVFNAVNLASGVYFYRLHAGDFVATKRLLLLK